MKVQKHTKLVQRHHVCHATETPVQEQEKPCGETSGLLWPVCMLVCDGIERQNRGRHRKVSNQVSPAGSGAEARQLDWGHDPAGKEKHLTALGR